jgi:hypothetical protein
VFYDVTQAAVEVLAIVTKADAESWLLQEGKLEEGGGLAKVKDDFSKHLRLAAQEEIVITRHGRPAGCFIGFESDEDWLDYRLEHDPEFLRRIAEARAAIRQGLGVRLEDLEDDAG